MPSSRDGWGGGGSLSQHLAQNPENSRLSPSILPHPLNPKELYPWNLPGYYEILHQQPIKMSEFLKSEVMKKKRKLHLSLHFNLAKILCKEL